MNISKPATLSSIDTSLSLPHPSTSDTIIAKDAGPPIGSTANGPSLWRSILDTHGREILGCASDQFLDLATALRLETINARDLVNLLAKAGRLRQRETDIVEDGAGNLLVHEAHGGPRPHPDTNSASTLPGRRVGQGRSAPTPSPEPSLVEAPREPKRQKTDERWPRAVHGPSHSTGSHPTQHCPTPLEKQCGSGLKRRRGGGRIQEQRLMSAMVGGNSRPVSCAKVGAVLQAEAPGPTSKNG